MKIGKCILLAAGAVALVAPLSHGLQAAELQVEESLAYLGGHSGEYTSWERTGIVGFRSLRTVVAISKVHGKSKDAWDAIARIKLNDNVNAKDDPTVFSLVFAVDRGSKEITPRIQLGLDQPWKQLPGLFSIDQDIEVKITRESDEAVLLQIAEETFRLPVDFPVTQLMLLGSGVDVSFKPIALTRE